MEHLWTIGGMLMEYAWNSDNTWMEYGRNIGGINLFGWIGMDMHESAWIDEDGHGGYG